MLQIEIPERELFDEKAGEFIILKKQTLKLEHSLIAISKWESKWHVPFLTDQKKTIEQTIDYIRCMTINKDVPDKVYETIPSNILDEINDYIADSMTATWFREDGNGKTPNREIITSEVLYYQMVKIGIPFECEKWHVNRLITLIRVYSEKEAPQKKMSPDEIRTRNRELNEARRAKMNSRG